MASESSMPRWKERLLSAGFVAGSMSITGHCLEELLLPLLIGRSLLLDCDAVQGVRIVSRDIRSTLH